MTAAGRRRSGSDQPVKLVQTRLSRPAELRADYTRAEQARPDQVSPSTALPWPALPSTAQCSTAPHNPTILNMSCPVLSCPALPCPALPWPGLVWSNLSEARQEVWSDHCKRRRPPSTRSGSLRRTRLQSVTNDHPNNGGRRINELFVSKTQ